MTELDDGRFESFRLDSLNCCAAEWENHKRSFLIHLDAKGLRNADGRQKVGQLLKHMGKNHIATYDTFTWRDILSSQAVSLPFQSVIHPEDSSL